MFLSGLVYTLGRILLYVILGILIVTFFLSVPRVSYFLQKYMNKALGPILVLTGIVLLEIVRFNIPGLGLSERTRERSLSSGLWGAFLMGIVFALSFCPVSAALFFGSLIPLSLSFGSQVAIPAIYGFGTGIPVIGFAILLSLGAHSVGRNFREARTDRAVGAPCYGNSSYPHRCLFQPCLSLPSHLMASEPWIPIGPAASPGKVFSRIPL